MTKKKKETPHPEDCLFDFSEGRELSAEEIEIALKLGRSFSTESGARIMVATALLRSILSSVEDEDTQMSIRRQIAAVEYDLLDASGMKCKLSRSEWIVLMMTPEEEDDDEVADREKADILNAEIIIDGGEQ